MYQFIKPFLDKNVYFEEYGVFKCSKIMSYWTSRIYYLNGNILFDDIIVVKFSNSYMTGLNVWTVHVQLKHFHTGF